MAIYDITQTTVDVDKIYTGDILICPEFWLHPYDVTLPVGTFKLEAWGGRGGPVSIDRSGIGGYSYGTYTTTQNTTLYLQPGERGEALSTTSDTVCVEGGRFGGGDGYKLGFNSIISSDAGVTSGGGYSLISLVNERYISNLNLSDILLVAGGGGGCIYGSNLHATGGAGGGVTGGDGQTDFYIVKSYTTVNPTGGSQSSGGIGGTVTAAGRSSYGGDGSYGFGGDSKPSTSEHDYDGGGGGGYEPSVEWCDINIPYFTNSAIIMNLSDVEYNINYNSTALTSKQRRIGVINNHGLTMGGAGTVSSDTTGITGYIPVPAGCTSITINNGGIGTDYSGLHEYGASFNYLSYWSMGNPRTFTFDYPNDVKYIRATFFLDNLDNCYIYDNTHGKYICRVDNNVLIDYNGNTIHSIQANESKALACSGKYMTTNLSIGDKMLACANKVMKDNVSVVTTKVNYSELITNVPTQSGSLPCTGSSQSPSWNNYDTNKLKIAGTTSGTWVGNYTAIFESKDGYVFADGIPNKSVTWAIVRGTPTITLSSSSGTATSTDPITITCSTNSDGTKSVSSSNTGVATVSISGNTITITPITNGTSTITVVTTSTSNFYSASTTYSLTVALPVIYTWQKWNVNIPMVAQQFRTTSNTVGKSAAIYKLSSQPSIIYSSGYKFDFTSATQTTAVNITSGNWVGANSDSIQTGSISTTPSYCCYITGKSTLPLKVTLSGNMYQIVEGTHTKGSTSYGNVTSPNRGAFPDNGEQGGYWYVFVG